MLRLTCAAFALCAIVAVAAPVPKTKPVEPYHSTTAGTTWVYETNEGDRTLTITKVEDKDGAKIATVCQVDSNGKPSPESTIAVTDSGLYRVDQGRLMKVPTTCLLPSPIRRGEEWTVEEDRWRAKVLGIETVKVPAGEFQAAHVDYEYLAVGGKGEAEWVVVQSIWYAPEVGPVKKTFIDGKVEVLKSFKVLV